MARILVTDGETRASLATTRALGRAGHEVYVVSSRLPALASVSRYCHRAAEIPALRSDPAAGIQSLLSLVEQWGTDLVVPVTDLSTLVILHHCGSTLGTAVVAAPNRSAFDALSDKIRLLDEAKAVGLTVPRSTVAREHGQLWEHAKTLGYPCIVKPHRSVAIAESGSIRSFGVRHVSREEDLEPPFDPAAFPVLVQEYVHGHGEGVFLLMDGSDVLAAFAHRRLREKPPEGGVSVYREAVIPDSELVGRSAALLRSVGWKGVAMVEFRTEGANAAIMEVNGRLWGSLQLAIDAGVDFPTMLVAMFLGRTVPKVHSYRTGVRTRWLWGDVDHVLARLRGRPGGRAGEGLPSVPRLLWDFLSQFVRRDDRLEVFDLSDPRPFVRETLGWFRNLRA